MPDFPGIRLTARGWALFVLGLLLAIAGALIGEPDITWVGVVLTLLPLITSLVLVVMLRPGLRVQRTVTPSEVPVGARPRATLDVQNLRPLAVSAVDFRDTTPSGMGADARFSLTRGFGRWQQPVGYDVRANQRGHFQLGPLRARCYDPLALSSYTWNVRSNPTSLRVTPRIHALDPVGATAGTGSMGEASANRTGQAGQDDVLVREHRPGDDIRRVHWKMSAKMDELMVRLEEQPWDPSLALVIDNRGVAHIGEGPDGSLEWAISMVASIASELLAGRYRLSIVSADGSILEPGRGDVHTAQDRMVSTLTDLAASGEPDLTAGLEDPQGLGNSRALVAVLGLLTAADAAALAAVGARMRTTGAIVPDPPSWGVPEERGAAHDEACRMLEANGWSVQRYRPGNDIPAVWRSFQTRRAAR